MMVYKHLKLKKIKSWQINFFYKIKREANKVTNLPLFVIEVHAVCFNKNAERPETGCIYS